MHWKSWRHENAQTVPLWSQLLCVQKQILQAETWDVHRLVTGSNSSGKSGGTHRGQNTGRTMIGTWLLVHVRRWPFHVHEERYGSNCPRKTELIPPIALVQFTVEVQKDDSSIEFLDKNKIKTKWFHKPIASNRLLNFHSQHPMNMIFNTATAFVKRVFTISHSSFHKENGETIRLGLKENNFLTTTIDELITKVRSSAHRNETGNLISYPFINNTTIANKGKSTDMTTVLVNNDPPVNFETTTAPNANNLSEWHT